MGTSRQSPESISGRKMAMDKAIIKNSNLPEGTVILSPAMVIRLEADSASYNAGIDACTATKQAYHAAVELARPQRILLKSNIISFFKTFNNNIDKLGTIPASARGFFNLPVGKAEMPDLGTDDRLLAMAALVLTGDAARVKNGGIAMNTPTIAEYTIVYNIAKPIIAAISNTHTAISTAVGNLKKQLPEIKNLVNNLWNAVEDYYSLNDPSNKRSLCRLWGIRYISTGVESVVTGTCKNELGVPIAKVKIRLVGSSHYTTSDAEGNFSLNTSLYGDLELLADLAGYEKSTTEFTKENGVAAVVAVVMEHSV